MASPHGEEGDLERRQSGFVDLDKNIVFEVLKRVDDPLTLAAASCVNCDFRSVCEEEVLWERLCNERWPSTGDSRVKSILASVGGYRKVYSDCYPSIVNLQQRPSSAGREEDENDRHEKEIVPPDYAPSDYISIVDVLYGDQSIFSRVVEGIPGADDIDGWFSTHPFRMDLLRPLEKEYHDKNSIMIEKDVPFMTSGSSVLKSGTRRDGLKFWKTLCDKLRLSWILINTSTKQMANLTSWKPLGGFRHWLSDEEFLLRFGSVLPGQFYSDSSVCGGAVQCNISLVCSLNFNAEAGEKANAALSLTELSLQLEDIGGALVNGKDSIEILQRALSCPKSRKCEVVVDSYHRYLKVRSELKAMDIRNEGRLNIAAAVTSGIITCLFFLWLLSF